MMWMNCYIHLVFMSISANCRTSFLVDSSMYDIAALDLYVEKDQTYGSRYEQYVALRNMSAGKILAISECSNVPDMNAMFRDNAVWSYFGLWYAP